MRKEDVGRKATAATPTGGTDPTAMQAAERGGARVETTSGPQVPPPPSAGSLAAAAAPLAAIDSPLLPELNGAYPFWLPGDIVPRKANGRTRGHGGVAAGVNGGRRTVIEAVPVEVHGVPAREGVAAAKEGSGAAVVAESTAEAKIDGAAGSSRRPSALDGEAIEVYGALADEYAAAVKETGHASAAAAPTTAAATGDVAKPRQPSVLDDETIEVYGVLADEYAAAAAEEAIRPAAAEIDEQRSRLRVEVETAAVVGRATVDLLAAIEQWAAEFVKAGAPLPEAVVLRVPDETAVQGPFAGGTVAIAEADLDGVRGGFDNGNGLRITFGIERAVYINGNLVTTTNFNVADLGKVTGGQAAPSTADKPGVDMVLIQNGPGNVVHPGIAHSTAGTVIQNTLNNQNINSVTLVNATVNSVQLFKGMDLQSMLRSAVNAAVQR